MVDVSDLMNAIYRQSAHYNMGRSGYGYGYECEKYPRVMFIDRTFRPCKEHPDGATTRTWYIDGAEVASIEAAAEALQKPPMLSDDERRVLALLPDTFEPLRRVEDDLAGVERPSGGIMPDTPHSRVLGWLHSLRAKGMIEYGKQPDRSDGQSWSDSVPEHMRWSPTVRRVSCA
jgi:hypothetical protein